MTESGMNIVVFSLVGQNLGAKRPDRAERSAWTISGVNMILLSIGSVVFITVPHIFINFFIKQAEDPLVWQAGIDCLRIISIGFLFCRINSLC